MDVGKKKYKICQTNSIVRLFENTIHIQADPEGCDSDRLRSQFFVILFHEGESRGKGKGHFFFCRRNPIAICEGTKLLYHFRAHEYLSFHSRIRCFLKKTPYESAPASGYSCPPLGAGTKNPECGFVALACGRGLSPSASRLVLAS